MWAIDRTKEVLPLTGWSSARQSASLTAVSGRLDRPNSSAEPNRENRSPANDSDRLA
jgi:hypothetical protein